MEKDHFWALCSVLSEVCTKGYIYNVGWFHRTQNPLFGGKLLANDPSTKVRLQFLRPALEVSALLMVRLGGGPLGAGAGAGAGAGGCMLAIGWDA